MIILANDSGIDSRKKGQKQSRNRNFDSFGIGIDTALIRRHRNNIITKDLYCILHLPPIRIYICDTTNGKLYEYVLCGHV